MTDLAKSRLRFDPYLVDLGTGEVTKSGVRVKITGQPFQVLAALLVHPGQLVTREELRRRIWSDDTYVDFSHGLNAAVNKLRDALGDSADDPRYVETLPRRGYRFIAAVELVEEIVPGEVMLPAVKQAPLAETVWKGPLAAEQEWQSTVPVKRRTLTSLLALGVAALLLAVTVAGLRWHWTASPSPSRKSASRWQENAANKSTEAEKVAQDEAISLGARRESTTSPAPAMPLRKARTAGDPWDDSALQYLVHIGGRMKFFRERVASDEPAILHLDLSKGAHFGAVTPVVAGRPAIAGPQPSPDGTKLVFMAGSNEMMDIWISNSDGSGLKQLTHVGRTGTPRWSPDGRWITFDSDGRTGRSGIYVVSADGGPIRTVVEDDYNNSVPSWSRDGKYIYFASNRGDGSGNDEVWKVAASGGQPIQTTRQGGFSAFESLDGKTLYYAKSRYEHPEIWQVAVDGGSESRVSLLHPSTWASWTVTGKGILLLSEYSGPTSELEYFDFATRSLHPLATLENASFWLASSANGSSIWYSELTDNQARQVFKAGLD